MISELSRLKLAPEWGREAAGLRLTRMLAFPSCERPMFAWDEGRLIYAAGCLLIVEGREQALLKGHDAEITAFSFCAANKLIATGQASSYNSKDYESKVIVWDGQSLKMKKVLVGLKQGVKGLAFSASGHVLAAVNTKNNLVLWETAGMTVIHQRVVEFDLSIIGAAQHLYFTIATSLYEFDLSTLQQSTFTIPSSGLKRGIVCLAAPAPGTLFLGTTSG
jgi:hypothetical protein